MLHSLHAVAPVALLVLFVAFGAGCAGPEETASEPAPASASAPAPAPSPAIQAWMDRLTVAHAWDPETGFIVAKETVGLPPVLADAPPVDVAVEQARADGRLVIAFATADRCAPCQQYKRDALNDARVVARLQDDAWIVTHVEVDRQGELADVHLGGRGIPMTYALRNGETVDRLRGQRSADELLAWLDALPAG